MARPFLYRFQYRKTIWGNLKKNRRKKMFYLKSMTKLEALTVVPSRCKISGKEGDCKFIVFLVNGRPPPPLAAGNCNPMYVVEGPSMRGNIKRINIHRE